MQKIKSMFSVAILSGVVLMLQPFALPTALHAQQPAAPPPGRGTRAFELSLPIVQQAFKITDARFLISFSRYCMLNGPKHRQQQGRDAATPSPSSSTTFTTWAKPMSAPGSLRRPGGLILIDTLNNPDEAASVSSCRACANWVSIPIRSSSSS